MPLISQLSIPQVSLSAGQTLGPVVTPQLPTAGPVGWLVSLNIISWPPSALNSNVLEVHMAESTDGLNPFGEAIVTIGADYQSPTWASNRPTPFVQNGFVHVTLKALQACTVSGGVSV